MSKFIFKLICTFEFKLIFLGDEFDEEEMLEWITDPNVQAVSDQIEEVNRKMFEKIRSRNDNLVVFFCKFILIMSKKCLHNWVRLFLKHYYDIYGFKFS